jgi:hypothetical protein
VGAEGALGGGGDTAAGTYGTDGLEYEALAVGGELELGVLVDMEQLQDGLLDDDAQAVEPSRFAAARSPC